MINRWQDSVAHTVSREPAPSGGASRKEAAEERQQMALDAARAGAWEYRPASGLFTADERAMTLHGVTLTPLKQATALECVHPLDREAVELVLKAALESGSEFRSEHRVLLPDGSTRWVLSQAELRGVGPEQRLVGLVQDITARKMAELDQARLAAIVESSDDAILAKDLEGIIISWNPAAERLFGFKASEVIGRSIFTLVPPDRHPEERELLLRIRQGESLPNFDTERLSRDGRRIAVSATFSPLHDPDGRVIGASTIARDNSERRRFEERLRARTQQLDLLATLSRELILQGARDEPLSGILSALASAIGVESWYHFRPWTEPGVLKLALHGGVSEAAQRAFDTIRYGELLCGRVAATGKAIVIEDLQHSGQEGTQALLAAGATSYAGFPLLVGRNLLGTVAFVSARQTHFKEGDLRLLATVCDQIAATLDRERLAAETQAANRHKDEFLAMLAHELRNPLAPISSAAEVLGRQLASDPEASVPLAIIGRQTGQLKRLVDDLLDVSRIAQGRIALQREPIEVGALIEQSVETIQPILTEKTQQVRVGTCREPLHVTGDRARLVQCLGNLLHNAAKFSEPHAIIEVRVHATPQYVDVEVEDRGAGIAPAVLPHVFEAFVQAPQTLARSRGGLGIGLAIVKRLVEMHGGSVWATSPGPGRGTTFTVRLPRSAGAEAKSGGSQEISSGKLRVLVVDDNVDAADSLAMLLALQGHETRAVYGARETLQIVSRSTIDAILLDIGLPEMDGYEVARRLRSEHGYGGRLIALTGYGQTEDRDRSRQAGFDAHLVKPVEIDTLARLLSAPRS